MKTRSLSIRAKVIAAFVCLIALTMMEALIILRVERSEGNARAAAARTEAILLNQAAMRGALGEMRTALRDFILAGNVADAGVYASERQMFQTTATATLDVIDDPGQLAQFAGILQLAREWDAWASNLIDRRQQGFDVAVELRSAVSRFEPVRASLNTFEARQRDLSREAAALADARVAYATTILTAVPLVAVVLLVGLLMATQRTILHPLGALASSARRLADGEYDAPLPTSRGDEIGLLVEAFSHMREAVHARADDAEAARRRVDDAHADLLAVLNTVPAGLVVMGPDGSVRLQNNAALHLLGTAPETPEARRAHWQQILIPNAAGQRMTPDELPAFRALAGVEVIGEEVSIRRPDGEQAELLIGAMPLRNAKGEITGVVSAFQDITRLRELDRLKDEFVAIVSHELRTPLTAIRGSLQLLLADNATTDPGHTELLAVGLKSCERLVRIINDMLDLSKIEAGRLQLNRALLSVETLLTQAAADLEPVAAQAGVRLATLVEPGLPPVNGDADRLTQALVNLVSNAIKFSPAGSTVQIAARITRLGVAIGVTDQGRGIAPEDISRLFQKFRQLDQPGTRRTGGTGLGLAITKGIVEEHGGTVVVDSLPGTGTTFTFTLPVGTGPDAHLVPRGGGRASGADVPLVLVVDNNEVTRGERVRAIQAAGFHTLDAPCGEAALALARREQPDVISVAVAETPGGEQWTIDALGHDPATRAIPVLVAVGADEGAREAGGSVDLTELVARVGATLEGRTQATILIADDDADTRTVLRTVLERRGYHVVEAADGAEALAAAARTPPDLVLLDLRMPRIHGHDVIRSLRRNAGTLRLPIIVLSGSVGERHSLYSLVLGANAFLTKPADPDTLIREIDRHVRRDAS